MTSYDFVTVDVFTTERFGGNPLAVVPDARGMSDAQMQRVAAEFNYSESTFVLPPDDPGNTARVRIFARTAEVPFAGHPNVGTGYVLARQLSVFGSAPGDVMRFEEKAGRVDVDVVRDEGEVAGARIAAPLGLETGTIMEPAVFASCVSLPPEAIVTRFHRPTLASVGLPFFVGETDIVSLADAHADLAAFRSAAGRYGIPSRNGRFSAFVYARRAEGIAQLRARMFAPLGNNWEDPATGSASAALGALLTSLEGGENLMRRIEIEQGVEMGRPSEIVVEARKSGDRVEAVTIEGRCVEVMRGRIAV